MIRQGSNEPLTFKFRRKDRDALMHHGSISFVVMDSGGVIYSWGQDEVEISDKFDTIAAPITQAQTLALDPGPVQIRCKIKDQNGNIIFCRDIWDYVVKGDPTYLGVIHNG